MGDQEYLLAFSRVLLPIALEFRPELCATAPAHNPHNPRRLVPAIGLPGLRRFIRRTATLSCPRVVVWGLIHTLRSP